MKLCSLWIYHCDLVGLITTVTSSLKTITPKAWKGGIDHKANFFADCDQLTSRFIPGKGCQQGRLQPEGKSGTCFALLALFLWLRNFAEP